MCTVTFLPSHNGYRLGMNRDESRKRVNGRPPARRRANRRWYLAPSEPTGGTWIAVNEQGVSLTLINWYAVRRKPRGEPVSRGEIIRTQAGVASAEDLTAALEGMPLRRMSPFRLIAFFPGPRRIVEWRWNLERLVQKKHRWETQQWASSGFDEPGAQRVRGATFQRARRQKTFGSLAWLRRLHASHAPVQGPFSICMHREDAATVSYTEVSVSGRNAFMRYFPGAPCAMRKRSGLPSKLTLQSGS